MRVADRYTVISSDCHAGASIPDYKPYLERRWHDEFEVWAAAFSDPWVTLDPGPPNKKLGLASGFAEGNWDSDLRLEALEEDGIAAEIVFPNTFPPFFPAGVLAAPIPADRGEYERRLAGIRAHNRWLVDFCNAAPGRRAGVAQILFNDIDDAVEDIRRAKADGLSAALIPHVGPGAPIPPLLSPRYEPIWAAFAEADLTINNHSAAPSNVPEIYGEGRGVGFIAASEQMLFFGIRAMWHMILSGVFERYPSLRYATTETRSFWVPQKLIELDYVYGCATVDGSSFRLIGGSAADDLTMKPSEYFARNCYLGASFMTPFEVDLRHEIGVGRIMWGNDYPHSEGTFPHSLAALRASFAGVAEDEVRLMLGETAAAVYGLDLAALAPVAARIGPKVADVATALSPADYPRVPEDSDCSVFIPASQRR